MKLRLQRLLPFGRISKRDSAIRAGREGSRGGSARGQKQHAAEAAVAVAVAGMHGRAGGAAGPPPSSAYSPEEEDDEEEHNCISSSSSDSEEDAQPEADAAGALVARGAAPHDAAAVAAAAGQAAEQAAQLEAASVVGTRCRGRRPSPAGVRAANGAADDVATDDSAAEHMSSVDARPTPFGAAAPPQQQREQQQQQREHRELQQRLPSYISVDLEAQEQPMQAARAAAAAADSTPNSSVFRRCCPWLVPRMPWHRGQQRKRVSEAIKRSQSFAQTWVPNCCCRHACTPAWVLCVLFTRIQPQPAATAILQLPTPLSMAALAAP
jgi:hypothetical protein